MARYINQLQNDNKALKRQVTLLKKRVEKLVHPRFATNHPKDKSGANLPKSMLTRTLPKVTPTKEDKAAYDSAARKEVDRLLAENVHLTNTCNEHYKKIMYHQRENERLKRGNNTLQQKLGAYQATVNGLCSLNVVNRRK